MYIRSHEKKSAAGRCTSERVLCSVIGSVILARDHCPVDIEQRLPDK